MPANARKDKFVGGNRPFINQGETQLEAFKVAIGAANAQRPYELRMDLIKIDQEIQVRVGGLNRDAVQAYMAILENEGDLQSIVVFKDEYGDYWLADGFHRYQAHINAGRVNIMAFVRDGGRNEALDYAESANLENGVMLTSADKKNILLRRLHRGHEWCQISQREIARQLGVSAPTVGNWIKEFELTVKNFTVDRVETIGADGKTRKTENIGKAPQPQTTSAETEATPGTETIRINGEDVPKRSDPVPVANGAYQIGGSADKDDLPVGVSFAKIDTGGDVVIPTDDVSAMRMREAKVKIPVRNILEATSALLQNNDAQILRSLPETDLIDLVNQMGRMMSRSLNLMEQVVPALPANRRGQIIAILNDIEEAMDGIAETMQDCGFFE